MKTVGLDFGTTNSTIGYNNGDVVEMINLGKNKLETRTALFWNSEERHFSIGDEGIQEYKDFYPGRLIQSPKSFLNSKHDIKTIIGGRVLDVPQICTKIISHFKHKLELILGEEVDRALVGRPVKFHDTNTELDRLAEKRLELAVKNAGFKYVDFEYEPIGAILAYKELALKEENILMIDLGGGTSDFSVVNIQPQIKGAKGVNILSNGGIYVGGDSFDRDLSMKYFSDFLGNNSLINTMSGQINMPTNYYSKLSDWRQLHTLGDRESVLSIQELYRSSIDKTRVGRLLEISQEPFLGFEYYSLIENIKKKLSCSDEVSGCTDFFKDNFNYILSREGFELLVHDNLEKISIGIDNTIKVSGLKKHEINKVVLTGGTSLIPAVRDIIDTKLGKGKIQNINTFSAVGEGLTIESLRLI